MFDFKCLILNLKNFWQVAIKGAQQKLNDKDLEEKEKLWQESWDKKWKFTIFSGINWIFLGLSIFLYIYMTSEETEKVKTKIEEGRPDVKSRPVESKSLKVGKSLKIGKNRIKSEKSEFIIY